MAAAARLGRAYVRTTIDPDNGLTDGEALYASFWLTVGGEP